MKSKFKTQGDNDTLSFELVDESVKLTIAARAITDLSGVVVLALNFDETEVLRDELDRYAKAIRAKQVAARGGDHVG